MKKDPFGVFEVVIPARDGQPAIAHNSKIKVSPHDLGLFQLLTVPDHNGHTLRRTN